MPLSLRDTLAVLNPFKEEDNDDMTDLEAEGDPDLLVDFEVLKPEIESQENDEEEEADEEVLMEEEESIVEETILSSMAEDNHQQAWISLPLKVNDAMEKPKLQKQISEVKSELEYIIPTYTKHVSVLHYQPKPLLMKVD